MLPAPGEMLAPPGATVPAAPRPSATWQVAVRCGSGARVHYAHNNCKLLERTIQCPMLLRPCRLPGRHGGGHGAELPSRHRAGPEVLYCSTASETYCMADSLLLTNVNVLLLSKLLWSTSTEYDRPISDVDDVQRCTCCVACPHAQPAHVSHPGDSAGDLFPGRPQRHCPAGTALLQHRCLACVCISGAHDVYIRVPV